jgi:hypothetical protein
MVERLNLVRRHRNRDAAPVYDTNFTPVEARGAFEDDDIPKGFAPFNVQNIGGNLYVA